MNPKNELYLKTFYYVAKDQNVEKDYKTFDEMKINCFLKEFQKVSFQLLFSTSRSLHSLKLFLPKLNKPRMQQGISGYLAC